VSQTHIKPVLVSLCVVQTELRGHGRYIAVQTVSGRRRSTGSMRVYVQTDNVRRLEPLFTTDSLCTDPGRIPTDDCRPQKHARATCTSAPLVICYAPTAGVHMRYPHCVSKKTLLSLWCSQLCLFFAGIYSEVFAKKEQIYYYFMTQFNVTQVLLELVTVREGGLCFPEFDDVFIRQFIECICTS